MLKAINNLKRQYWEIMSDDPAQVRLERMGEENLSLNKPGELSKLEQWTLLFRGLASKHESKTDPYYRLSSSGVEDISYSTYH